MSFDQEPRNWRNVAKVTHEDGELCSCLYGHSDLWFYGCDGVPCSKCKMNATNPDRASYIQSCKDRLVKEEQSMNWKAHADLHAMYNIPDTKTKETAMKETETPLYDLTKIGPVLSFTPVVVECNTNNGWHQVTLVAIMAQSVYKYRYYYIDIDGVLGWSGEACHPKPIYTPRLMPMTAYDIACLPRGTDFVDDDGSTYCPTITQNADGYTEINGSNVINYNGYILPDSTELRPFTKEV